jgi:hypothetical protein
MLRVDDDRYRPNASQSIPQLLAELSDVSTDINVATVRAHTQEIMYARHDLNAVCRAAKRFIEVWPVTALQSEQRAHHGQVIFCSVRQLFEKETLRFLSRPGLFKGLTHRLADKGYANANEKKQGKGNADSI